MPLTFTLRKMLTSKPNTYVGDYQICISIHVFCFIHLSLLVQSKGIHRGKYLSFMKNQTYKVCPTLSLSWFCFFTSVKKIESTNSLGSYHVQQPVHQGKHCCKLLVQNESKTYRSLWRKRKCS